MTCGNVIWEGVRAVGGLGSEEGFFALALAILYADEITADDAFEILNGGKARKTSRKKIDPMLIVEFVRMKQTMTYKEIGKIYNLAPDTVCRCVKQAERAS